ncbi:hypothetical protein CASFOL_007679 [Castilleja foliolosa]|uniref:Uncharacterized protein n=1 Tax=Castilleja foliolosa TaxID=1961234 RepID=A0ABD3E175_9LAMI
MRNNLKEPSRPLELRALELEINKLIQVLEVRSIDSISMNLEKRVEGWNERITRILGMPWTFLIGAELTIVFNMYIICCQDEYSMI